MRKLISLASIILLFPTGEMAKTKDFKIDLLTRSEPISTPEVKLVTSEDISFLECINHIKEYEGFVDSIYLDTDGSRTIGYGHHLIEGEGYTKISEKEATRILKNDLKKRIKWVKKNTELKGVRAFAIALFCFNIGETKYINSTLNKLIESNQPIDEEIVKWKWFKYKGELKENIKLKERRTFELAMFKK